MQLRIDRRARRAVAAAATALALVGVLVTVTRTDGSGPEAEGSLAARDGANEGPLPTIPGGVELPPVDPTSVLVGAGLAFGAALPSEEAAAQALTATPEIRSVLVRRVYEADGRRVGRVLVAAIDGQQLFDDAALRAFRKGLVGSLAGAGPAEVVEAQVGGRTVLEAPAPEGAAVAFQQGDQLVVTTGAADQAAGIVSRVLEAVGRGEQGSRQPATPLPATPVGAAFVPMATLSFAPIPPPEVEVEQPERPSLPGATAVEGRYGVVAGERRTVVWAFTVDPATYPTAESLEPALGALASARAEGTAPTSEELIDRMVVSATNPAGTRSARAFRHQGLVLLVEGDRPDQLDAVVTAWITALGPT